MKVIAYIPAFNEADILPWTLKHLRARGVEPYVIDNWSTDGTWQLINQMCFDGPLFGCTRFPADGPSATYDWTAILKRIEDLAAGSDADWCMFQDADEIRRHHWQPMTLDWAFEQVQGLGYNAVSFRCLNFLPVDNGWNGTQNPEEYFQFIEQDSIYSRVPHIKAWRNVGRVDLASTGGHEARFDGRMVFPTPFLSKHYGIRSQAQAERKVFRDRVPRWNPEERAKGWHAQYQGIQPGHSFIRPKEELVEWQSA